MISPVYRTWRPAAAAMLLLAALPACRRDTRPAESTVENGSLPVFVSIPPQKYFVERLGGDYVKVSVMLPPGQSPATYEPTPKQMVELSAAQAYFKIGLPFEHALLDKIAKTIANLEIVDTCANIELHRMAEPHHHGHSHDCDHDHTAGELDPHTWMDPQAAKLQVQTICRTLCRLDPTHAPQYRENGGKLEQELDAVDAQIAELLAPWRGRDFYVFHPAFGYFAKRYGLVQVAVEAGGKEPTAKQLGTLIERAKAANVKLIFVQPQFSDRSARTVAESIGGAVVAMDPMAENYLDNLLEIASKIEAVVGSSETDRP